MTTGLGSRQSDRWFVGLALAGSLALGAWHAADLEDLRARAAEKPHSKSADADWCSKAGLLPWEADRYAEIYRAIEPRATVLDIADWSATTCTELVKQTKTGAKEYWVCQRCLAQLAGEVRPE